MESFQDHYNCMMKTIAQHCPQADLAIINRAVDYARAKHDGQLRKDGSPYIIHPLAVAEIVAETGLDTDAILGAILHDCIQLHGGIGMTWEYDLHLYARKVISNEVLYGTTSDMHQALVELALTDPAALTVADTGLADEQLVGGAA